MSPKMTEHVSLTVADVDEATEFYAKVFGWRLVEKRDEWTEMASGPLRFYLVADDGPSPMFAVAVQDVQESRDQAVASGCRVVEERADEVFLTDPYGHAFCLTAASG